MPDGAKPSQVSKAVIRNAPLRGVSLVNIYIYLAAIEVAAARAVPFK